MGAKSSRFFQRSSERKPGTILMVGLDGAGKTTIANLLQRKIVQTEPTMGCDFSMNAFECKEFTFSICDVGGRERNRYMWRNFKRDHPVLNWDFICGVIFVVDSSDVARIGEARELHSALHRRLAEDHRRPVLPVLVIANKQDRLGALTAHEVTEMLSLSQYRFHGWHVTYGGTGADREGLYKAMWILYKMIKKREKLLKKFYPNK